MHQSVWLLYGTSAKYMSTNGRDSEHNNTQSVYQFCHSPTYTKTVTMYLSKFVYIPRTVQVSICLSPTTSLKSQMMETTNMLSTSSFIDKSYPSPTHSPATETLTCTSALNRAIGATGAIIGLLVVLLIVVTTGWVYTCSRRKELGLRSRNVRYNIMAMFHYWYCVLLYVYNYVSKLAMQLSWIST